MVGRTLVRLAGAAALVLALGACSSDGSSSSAGSSPTEESSSPTGASTGAACTALDDVKNAAETVKSDVQAKNFSAATLDIKNLDAAVQSLIVAVSAGAQQQADKVTSSWDQVTSTFQGLSKSDVGQLRSTMQGPIQQFKATLESVRSSLSCS